MKLMNNIQKNWKKWLTHNGQWFLMPIYLWNIIFAQKLTSVGYMAKPVDLGVLGIIENIFRIGIFAWPTFMLFNLKDENFKKYFTYYIIGTMIYFTSWLIIIFMPQSTIANTWFIKLAPAYTTIIYFYAIGKLGQNKYYKYLALIFVLIHTTGTLIKLSG
ncbi:MAG: hypothetical protein ABF289_19525 [Clostridiales bacterium]